jgi:hypothetical protein
MTVDVLGFARSDAVLQEIDRGRFATCMIVDMVDDGGLACMQCAFVAAQKESWQGVVKFLLLSETRIKEEKKP